MQTTIDAKATTLVAPRVELEPSPVLATNHVGMITKKGVYGGGFAFELKDMTGYSHDTLRDFCVARIQEVMSVEAIGAEFENLPPFKEPVADDDPDAADKRAQPSQRKLCGVFWVE